MELLEIETHLEQLFVFFQIFMAYETDDWFFYTGASNLISNDITWHWIESNQTTSFQMVWYPEDRIDSKNLNCLSIRKFVNHIGFYQVDCNTEHGFICQEKFPESSNGKIAQRIFNALSKRIM